MSNGIKKGLVFIGSIVVGVVLIISVYRTLGGEEVPANTRKLMCSETGALFAVEVKPGMGPYPHKNPKTDRDTLYPVELCYNGPCLEKDGTPVILNTWLGQEEPTYCPVCGHIVRAHNPGPPQPE